MQDVERSRNKLLGRAEEVNPEGTLCMSNQYLVFSIKQRLIGKAHLNLGRQEKRRSVLERVADLPSLNSLSPLNPTVLASVSKNQDT